jgi:hypothetical protein
MGARTTSHAESLTAAGVVLRETHFPQPEAPMHMTLPNLLSAALACGSVRQRRRDALLACACLVASGCFEARVSERDAAAREDAGEDERDDDSSSAVFDAAAPEEDGGAAAVTPEPDGPVSCRTPDVDLLFVIDNSGSMAEEQQKLALKLPELLGILATGNHDGKRSVEGEPTDFTPAQTLHVGVISTDLGINLAPAIESCGGASYEPTAPDPANTTASVRSMALNGVRLDRPFGDDGMLLTSTDVAEAGIWARPFGTTFATPVTPVVEPDPSCANVRPSGPYLEYTPGDRFEDTQQAFSCIAKLGKNGCGLEQQLESMLKALTPSRASTDFSRGTRGQGSAPGANAGFLRDDAILVVVVVSDEEDCSIPDESSDLFNRNSAVFRPGDINTRCGKPENQRFLRPVQRYIDGLRALKSEQNQERIIVATITGLPLAKDLDGAAAHHGRAELEAILARQDMQFSVRSSSISTSDEEPVPTCISAQGDGSAAPGRRFLELAQGFGYNGIAASICEDDYGATVELLSERIARQLGSCE